MEYAPYIAAVAALLAGIILYRRRKVRKPRYHFYCHLSVPPGGDPATDGVRFLHCNPTTPAG